MQLSHAQPTKITATTVKMFWTKSRTKLIGDLVTYIIVITFSFVILIPVLWMLSTALKELSEVFLFPPRWIPAKLNWGNFPKALTFLPFAQYFANTSLITFGAMIGQLRKTLTQLIK